MKKLGDDVFDSVASRKKPQVRIIVRTRDFLAIRFNHKNGSNTRVSQPDMGCE